MSFARNEASYTVIQAWEMAPLHRRKTAKDY